ncbi:MAG: choice-of-anchor D domain-containing protein [bacterium]
MGKLCTILFALSLFFFPSLGRALVTINVPADMSLQAALTAAQSDGDDNVINIAAGLYDASSATFTYTAAENFSLTLVGAGIGSTILDGGGVMQVMNLKTGSPDDLAGITVRAMTVQNGKAPIGGGANIQTTDADINVDGVLFFQNGAAIGGGLELVNQSGNINLTNSLFDRNAMAFIGAGVDANSDTGTITLQGNQFTGNQSGAISGGVNTFNDSGATNLIDNIITGNSASGAAIAGGGEASSVSGPITLRGNQIIGNSSNVIAGGFEAFSSAGGTVTFDGNLIVGNTSNNIVGGGEVGTSGAIIFTNNIIAGNSAASSSGGIEIFLQAGGSTADIINNTIVGNLAGADRGGLELLLVDNAAVGNIYNNIIWGNGATGSGADIFVTDDGDADNVGSTVNLFNNDYTSLAFACVAPGCTPNVNQGANLIDQDPLFVDPALMNLHLGNGSPVIDKGLASAPALPATDFDGNPRIIGSEPDMGALEALPNITLSPATQDYGSLRVGANSAAVFTISNNGAGSLVITGMILSDTKNFTLDVNGGPAPCGSLTPTIATGGSCTVVVTFNPAANGSFTATLTVSSEDPDNPTVQSILTGIGLLNPLISGSGCALTGGEPSAAYPLLLLLSVPLLAAWRRKTGR